MKPHLQIHDIYAGYGDSVVVQDVSIDLQAGGSLAVLGRNGAGKSTLLATLAGTTRLHSGHIRLNGHDLTSAPSYQRARSGLGWVPQERAVFTTLTVDENLSVVARPGYWNTQRVYECFPRLAERRHNRGAQLSGGEQQMLSIGRALMLNPCVLMLDEPLEGLAPMVATDLLQILSNLMLKHAMTVIIVEQNPQQILPITEQAIILERGRIVLRSCSETLLTDADSLDQWLGIQTKTSKTKFVRTAQTI